MLLSLKCDKIAAYIYLSKHLSLTMPYNYQKYLQLYPCTKVLLQAFLNEQCMWAEMPLLSKYLPLSSPRVNGFQRASSCLPKQISLMAVKKSKNCANFLGPNFASVLFKLLSASLLMGIWFLTPGGPDCYWARVGA